MEESKINDLLDHLIMQTQNVRLYEKLSTIQKAIASLELLIGTSTRSGLTEFFDNRNEFLFKDVIVGFALINAKDCLLLYEKILSEGQKSQAAKKIIKELEEKIVVGDFNYIYDSIREFARQYFFLLER